MELYRFVLEPYNGLKSRYTCPKCNKSRQFARYIDTDTGEQLPEHVGRCNREIECGHHFTPKQYYQENPNQETTSKPRPAPAPPKPVSYMPLNIFKLSRADYEHNNFALYLASLFGTEVTAQLIARYHLGTSKHWPGATVFWQIDQAGKIRAGKVMLYDPATGRRVKQPYSHITWAHKALKLDDYNLKQCFFGEHLLSAFPAAPVGVVESEKTAMIASAFIPSLIWLASGSLSNITDSRCTVLKGRTVHLFPDLNGFEKWSAKAKDLGTNYRVSDLLERHATDAERASGYDLADYLARYDYREFTKEPEPAAPVPWDERPGWLEYKKEWQKDSEKHFTNRFKSAPDQVYHL